MNRNNSSYKDYQKSDTYNNEEYNKELESYLYANIYYTHNEQDRCVNTQYSSDSIHTPTNYDNFTNKYTVNNILAGQSNCNRSKRYPPRFRGISQHLSQADIPTNNHAESNMNIPSRNEVYHNNDINRKKQANNLSPSFNYKHQNNKPHSKNKVTRQHIRFAEEDLQNLSNDFNTELQDIEQNFYDNVLNEQQHSSTMLQSAQMDSNNSDNSIITQSSDTNVKHRKGSNILKKYEFSKQSIKNLYVQKYKELKKRYHKKKQKSKEQPAVKDSLDKNEIHSRYNVIQKSQKGELQTAEQSNHNDSLTVDSDSDESILEVPIPPKPQPPLISLNDSDEETTLTNKAKRHENDIEKSAFINSPSVCSELDFLNTNEEAAGCSHYDNYSRSENLEEYDSNMTLTSAPDVANTVQTEASAEDIVLNCTGIQKCASTSLIEIKNTWRAVQQVQEENNFENMVNSETVGEGEDVSGSNIEAATEVVHNTVNSESSQEISFENTPSNEIHTGSINQVLPLEQRKQKIGKRCYESPAQKKDSKRKKNNDVDDDVIILDSNVNSSRIGNRKDKWEQYFFKPMTEEMRMFYSKSSTIGTCDIQDVQKKMSKDPRLWGILDEDLMPRPSRRSKSGRCNHCHQDGHTRINCPEPRRAPLCYMCGTKGHTETRCPQKMCLTCGKKQSTYRKTCESCRKYQCTRCKTTGHKASLCPDLWRKYHLTTTSSTITVPDNPMSIIKPTHLLYCCNCAKQGHDSSTCNTYRWSPHYPTPVHVSNYASNPRYEKDSQITIAKNTQEDIVPIANCSQQKTTDKNYKTLFKYGPDNVPNGQLCRFMSKRNAHLNGVIEGQVFPHFFDYLSKHVVFYVEFRLINNGSFQIYCRGEKCYLQSIMSLTTLWLNMEDDEKNRWVITELPLNKKKIVSILNLKFDELHKDLLLEENPKLLWKKIVKLKKDLKKVENDQSQYNTFCEIKNHLLNLQTKVLTVVRNKPKWSTPCQQLYTLKDALVQKPRIRPVDYLHILANYHLTFTPHSPKNIDRLIGAYNSRMKKKRSNDRLMQELQSCSHLGENIISFRENTTVSEQNQPCEPSLINTTQRTESSTIESDPPENIQSSDALEKTPEDPCTINNNAPPVDFSNDIDLNINDATTTAELYVPTITSENQIYTNALESEHLNIAHKIEKVELEFPSSSFQFQFPAPPNHDTATSTTENTTVNQNCKPEVDSFDFPPTVTDKLSVEDNSEDKKQTIEECNINVPEKEQISMEIQGNKEIENMCTENSNVSTEPKTVNIVQSSPSAIRNESSDITIKEEQDVCVIVANVSEKPKELTKLTEDVIERANCVTNAALDFHLPYMDKAVMEVQKRLNDNILEHKHIDVLQKLIDLEKLHQEHVNTFSKFLE